MKECNAKHDSRMQYRLRYTIPYRIQLKKVIRHAMQNAIKYFNKGCSAKCNVQGSRKYMLGRPFHIFSALAQAYMFDIRRPMYYVSFRCPYKTLYFLCVSIIVLYVSILCYYFLFCLAPNIFGCTVDFSKDFPVH